MYCSKCGTKNDEGSRFCGKCGSPMTLGASAPQGGASPYNAPPPYSQPPQQPYVQQPYTQQPYGYEQKQSKVPLILAITALVVVVVGVAIGLFFWLNGNKTAPASTVSNIPNTTAPAAVPGNSEKFVGISLPTKSLQRWLKDGAKIKDALKAKGYKVDLQYADNDPTVQIQQIENQISMGCDVLVITAVDSESLGPVLDQAKEKNIPVIAYDRMLLNTDKCDYYITFDNYGVGKMQGDYIISRLSLDKGQKGPFTMECFAGDPGDNYAKVFNMGAMYSLQDYIDSGALMVKSGQTSFESIAIPNWSPDMAQQRMGNLLTAYYTDENIDVVLSPNDSIAQGIVAALKEARYGTSDKPFPILTGQDCDRINIGQIIRGEQSMSVFKDTRLLADQIVVSVDEILSGETVQTNSEYTNGVIKVKSFNCLLSYADKDNWKSLLVDSGYYALSDIPDAS